MEVPTVSASTIEGAFDEGLTIAILTMYRDRYLDVMKTMSGERADVKSALVYIFKMHPEDADYWLDQHSASD